MVAVHRMLRSRGTPISYCVISQRQFSRVHLVGTRHPWLMPSITLSWHLTWDFASGDDGNRTHDIYLAKVALCQLSYVPGWGTTI